MVIRLIRPDDSAQVAKIIKAVMPEFGASGAGFAIHDKEVEDMFAAYTRERRAYYVCENETKILGGGGIAPLEGGGESVCELKKMYFLPEARGKGLGSKVLQESLKSAKDFGFKICYLETFNTMTKAMHVYEQHGFKKINGPMGNTGHFSCDTFYAMQL
jgi:putative acetyltransferase